VHDAVMFDMIAQSLRDGEGMKAGDAGHRDYFFQRTPLYPAFLAGVYTVFGYNILWVQILQSIIGSLTVLLFYLLCREYVDRRIATLAAAIMALYAPMAAYVVAPMTETLTVFYTVLTTLLFVRAWKRKSLWYWASVGLMMAVLNLHRPQFTPFWMVIAAAIVLRYRKDIGRMALVLVTFLGLYYAAIAPWLIYVHSHAGVYRIDTVPLEPNTMLYQSILDVEKREGRLTPAEKRKIEDSLGGYAIYGSPAVVKPRNAAYLHEHLGAFVKVALIRFNSMWVRSFWAETDTKGTSSVDISPFMKKAYFHGLHPVPLLLNLVANLFGLLCLIGLVRFGWKTLPLALPLLYAIVPLSFLDAEDRYGLPLHPAMILYGAMTIYWIADILRSRSRSRVEASVAPAA
jgi:4-amino-4-deoxy-L-arabinose transferase-like glycosyltransferase